MILKKLTIEQFGKIEHFDVLFHEQIAAITVPDAVAPVKAVEGIQTTTAHGGNGAFREVVDCLVNS